MELVMRRNTSCSSPPSMTFASPMMRGKIRKADDDKIVMVTRRALKSAKPRREEDDFRKDKKERQEKKPSEGPCLKCGGKHGIFACKDRCKKIGYCVVCGEDRKECTNMWECSERHADSK